MRDGLDEMPSQDTIRPLAIIGMAFELPGGATTDESFWKMIIEGRSTSTDFPKDRVNIDAFYHPDVDRTSTLPLRGGHFVKEDLGAFDAPFFSITPAEARCMDPQHRRLLETSYLAMEDAGITLDACCGSDTSVFTGCFTSDYEDILQQDLDSEHRHAGIGVASSMLANRVSWFYNLRGTSMNVDTACSSSLVALHLAFQELQAGKSSMALVGGANLVFHPNFMKMMANGRFLSPSSRCWSFDSRCDGYARGEGSAVILIKRLDDAIRDGNTVRAIIRNTGSNQDGRTLGITQPNGSAQEELLRKTYSQAGLLMKTTQLFEAHGTGTKLGDPIEAKAIGAAFSGRSSEESLFVGAVKANLGHLEAASGLAGLIKVVLALEAGIIPPIASLQTLNPSIDAQSLGLKFPKNAVPWPSCAVRRACVNSFGYGGTNAVAILDDASHYLESRGLYGHHRTQPLDQSHQPRSRDSAISMADPACEEVPGDENGSTQRFGLLVWSSAREAGTRALSDAYRVYLVSQPKHFHDLAYVLATKRSAMPWRAFTVVSSDTTSVRDVVIHEPRRALTSPRLGFVFTGQGAQYIGMGRELLGFVPFRRSIETCDRYLTTLGCPWTLRRIIEGTDLETKVDNPGVSQPLCTCVQIAVVVYLKSLGIWANLVVGHSSGEIAAAYAMGALTLQAAVRVAYHRGVLSSDIPAADSDLSMTAVGISEDHAQEYLDRLSNLVGDLEVGVGCVNSPQSITLSGKTSQLSQLERWFAEDSVFARRLRVPLAYHSRFMDVITEKYVEAMGVLETSADPMVDNITMVSSVTGQPVSKQKLSDPSYWTQNLTSPVQFSAALRNATVKGPQASHNSSVEGNTVTHLLEIGPHSALQGPIRECFAGLPHDQRPVYLPAIVRKKDASITLLEAVGTLHCAGFPVDILAANGLGQSFRGIPPGMPAYPFDHSTSYWAENRISRALRFPSVARHDLLGTRSLDWNPLEARWRNTIRTKELPWLLQRTTDKQISLTPAALIIMAIEAFVQIHEKPMDHVALEIKDLSFPEIVTFHEDGLETQVTLSAPARANTADKWHQFRIFAFRDDQIIECCSGSIMATENWDLSSMDYSSISEETSKGNNRMLNQKDSAVSACSVLRNIQSDSLGRSTAEFDDALDPTCGQTYRVHPTLIDAMFGLMSVNELDHDLFSSRCPHRIETMTIYAKSTAASTERMTLVVAGQRSPGRNCAVTDAMVMDSENAQRPFLILNGIEADLVAKPTSEKRLYLQRVWKPDLDAMTPDSLKDICIDGRPRESQHAVEDYQALLIVVSAFMYDALHLIEEQPHLPLPQHLKSYVAWLRYQRERLRKSESQITQESVNELLAHGAVRVQMIHRVEQLGVEGAFFVDIGRNIRGILQGKVDPLDLMFRNGQADRYYEQVLGNEHHAYPASIFVELMSFKKPNLKILEVGAGTGGQTARILETVSTHAAGAHYDYTDISPGFFAQAREKFAELVDMMTFRVCDISRDPASQNFIEGSYDLVVASNVLHATNELEVSLRNVRKLLKPDGKLLLFEVTSPDVVHVGFAFGLLKGWWDPVEQEKRSTHSPCLSMEDWNTRLRASGFSGVDIEIPGQDNEFCRWSSIIVSSAVGMNESPFDAVQMATIDVAIIIDAMIQSQSALAESLQQAIDAECDSCHIYSISDPATNIISSSVMILSLLEVDAAYLTRTDVHPAGYANLQALLLRCKNFLWVTKTGSDASESVISTASELGNHICSEDPSTKFVTLSFTGADQTAKNMTSGIRQVIQAIFSDDVASLETDLILTSGILHIGRIRRSDEATVAASVRKVPVTPLRKNHSGLKLVHQTRTAAYTNPVQGLDNVGSRMELHVQDDEIFVDVKAIGLTSRDNLIARGALPPNAFSLESAGIVKIAGRSSGYSPGDRVCVISQQAGCSGLIVDKRHAALIPTNLTLSEAASMPVALWLATHALETLAHVVPDDRVLVLQATSAVGQMIVQVARAMGANVVAVVSSKLKRQHLRETLQLPDACIIGGYDASPNSELRKAAQDCKFDVIVGAIESLSSLTISEILAPGGCIVDTTLQARRGFTKAGASRMPPNSMFATLNLAQLLDEKPRAVLKTFASAVKIWNEKQLKPPGPLLKFGVHEVAQALQSFEDRDAIGKRVIEIEAASLDETLKQPESREMTADASCLFTVAEQIVSGTVPGRPVFSHLASNIDKIASAASQTQDTLVDKSSLLQQAGSQEEATGMIQQWFVAYLAQLLGVHERDIEASKPLHVYGIDSLVAIDLRKWFARETGAHVNVPGLLGEATLHAMCLLAAKSSRHQQTS